MKLGPKILSPVGACALGLAAHAGGEVSNQTTVPAEAVAVIREMRTQRLLEPGPLVEQLVNAVRGDATGLLDVLSVRSVPSLDDEGPQTLSEPQELLILEAMRVLGRDACLAALVDDPAEASELDERERIARILLYGTVGRPEDLEHVLRLGRAQGQVSSRVATSVRRAVVDLVDRDPAVLEPVRFEFRQLPTELGVAVLGAVGGPETPAEFRLFEDALGYREDLALVALGELGESRRATGEFARPVVELVRARLDDPAVNVRMQAANASGALEDRNAVESLIALLDDEHRGVAASAHTALTSIGGVRLPRARVAWERWHERELAWAARERDEAYADLTSANGHRRQLALKGVLEHRLYRHESVQRLAEALALDGAGVRGTAFHGLVALATPEAVEHLEGLLEDEDAGLRRAAEDALAKLGR